MTIRKHHDLSVVTGLEKFLGAAVHKAGADFGVRDRAGAIGFDRNFQAAVIARVIAPEIQRDARGIAGSEVLSHADRRNDSCGISAGHGAIVSLVGPYVRSNRFDEPLEGSQFQRP